VREGVVNLGGINPVPQGSDVIAGTQLEPGPWKRYMNAGQLESRHGQAEPQLARISTVDGTIQEKVSSLHSVGDMNTFIIINIYLLHNFIVRI
jgi:hypothetical protein